MTREGATVERHLAAGTDAVALVLADPRTYDGVVVGSRRIRWFDARWPEPGARFHHTIGFGPLTIRDSTEVIEDDLPRRLRMIVHVGPMGDAEVVFRVAPRNGGADVEMTETPLSGPMVVAWSLPADLVTRWRNDRVLRRLEKLALGRERTAALDGGIAGADGR